jgi:hypothetical protein
MFRKRKPIMTRSTRRTPGVGYGSSHEMNAATVRAAHTATGGLHDDFIAAWVVEFNLLERDFASCGVPSAFTITAAVIRILLSLPRLRCRLAAPSFGPGNKVKISANH